MLLTSQQLETVKQIWDVKIPESHRISNPSNKNQQISVYNIAEPNNFLYKIITEYKDLLAQIPANNEADEKAFNDAIEVMERIYSEGKGMLEFAAMIREKLSTLTTFPEGVGKSLATKTKNDALEKTIMSFDDSGNIISSALPKIAGMRSCLLASLYEKYLRMSMKAYILNADNTGLETLLGTQTEWTGKWTFKIDNDARRDLTEQRKNTLQAALDENRKTYLKGIVQEDNQELLSNLIVKLDNLLTVLKSKNEALETNIYNCGLELSILKLLENELLQYEANELDLESFRDDFQDLLWQEHYTESQIENFLEWFSKIEEGIILPPADNVITTVFHTITLGLFSKTENSPSVHEQILEKVKEKKESITNDLKVYTDQLQKQELLVRKLTEIRDQLNQPWNWFKTDKLKKLNGLIEKVSVASYITDEHINNIKEILNERRWFKDANKDTTSLKVFATWENEIFKQDQSHEKALNKSIESEEKKKNSFIRKKASEIFGVNKTKKTVPDSKKGPYNRPT